MLGMSAQVAGTNSEVERAMFSRLLATLYHCFLESAARRDAAMQFI
jgi:hypothetical protein